MNELIVALLKKGVDLQFSFNREEDRFSCTATWLAGGQKYFQEISLRNTAILEGKCKWVEECLNNLAAKIVLPG